ncbi:hypothetical protein V1478_003857, partial [Vespula squamosa]
KLHYCWCYSELLKSELRHIPFDKLIVYALALCISFGSVRESTNLAHRCKHCSRLLPCFACQCSQLLSYTKVNSAGLGLRVKYLDLVNMNLHRTLIKINLHSTDLEFTSLKFMQVSVTRITCLGLSINY